MNNDLTICVFDYRWNENSLVSEFAIVEEKKVARIYSLTMAIILYIGQVSK